MLQELGEVIPRTHELEDLYDLLLPHDATLRSIGRWLGSLTKFAVQYRYPGEKATTRQMRSALGQAQRIRTEIRKRLGLEE